MQKLKKEKGRYVLLQGLSIHECSVCCKERANRLGSYKTTRGSHTHMQWMLYHSFMKGPTFDFQ